MKWNLLFDRTKEKIKELEKQIEILKNTQETVNGSHAIKIVLINYYQKEIVKLKMGL